jgi:putative ATPase
VAATSSEPVPLHLRNAVTNMMKNIGYGKGYKYAHDYEDHFVRQQNLPEAINDKRYYHPGQQGFEKQISSRLQAWWPERFNK